MVVKLDIPFIHTTTGVICLSKLADNDGDYEEDKDGDDRHGDHPIRSHPSNATSVSFLKLSGEGRKRGGSGIGD